MASFLDRDYFFFIILIQSVLWIRVKLLISSHFLIHFLIYICNFPALVYWLTALWPWAYFLASTFYEAGAHLMLGWISLKVQAATCLLVHTTSLILPCSSGPTHANLVIAFYLSFSGRYSEGESRYNLSNATIKSATKANKSSQSSVNLFEHS